MREDLKQVYAFLEEADTHLSLMEEADARLDLDMRNIWARALSESLCDAAHNVIVAIAIRRGWPHEDDRYKENIVRRLSEEYNDSHLESAYRRASHIESKDNFGNYKLDDAHWKSVREYGPRVHNFVTRMLELAELYSATGQ